MSGKDEFTHILFRSYFFYMAYFERYALQSIQLPGDSQY